MKTILVSLKDLLEERGSDYVESIFQCFYNTKDQDIQDFLRNKAVEYNNRKWCYTYLIVRNDEFERKGEIIIEGYFTLSNKVIKLTDEVSNTTRKKLFFGLRSDDQNLPCILIGQLGKYIGSDRVSPIDLEEILDYAMDIIEQIDHRIAFSCVILEYEPNRIGLRQKYEEYGFKELQKPDEYIQMFLIL